MTDINDIKRELEALNAKVAAYEAEKATKRNWPERIEAGMVFRFGADRYLLCGPRLVNLVTGGVWCTDSDPFGGDEKDFTYEGKLDLTIRTDAHEPTGAELVGKVCEFADLMSGPWSPGECAAFGRNPDYPYKKDGGAEWKFARLAK